MYRLYIFGLEGVLIRPPGSHPFTSGNIFEWIPGRMPKLLELYRGHARCAIATNESGVAFGYRTLTQDYELFRRLNLELGAQVLHPCLACHTHPQASVPLYQVADDPRRKPNPGMLLEILQRTHMEPEDALVVGNSSEDEEAARRAGIAYQDAHEFFA